MKPIWCLLFLSLAAVQLGGRASGFHVASETPKVSRVFGGSAQLDIRVAPFVASWSECTATIISPSWLLTAAHCVQKLQASGFGKILWTGIPYSVDLEGVALENYVEKSIAHEDYPVNDYTHPQLHDIGLIKLEEPLQFNDYQKPVRIACRAEDLPKENDSITIYGFGQYGPQHHDFQRTLQQLTETVSPRAECEATYGPDDISDLICARTPKGEAGGLCNGDSGAPAIDARGQLVGIASFSFGTYCNSARGPDLYVRVADYWDWILRNVGSEDAEFVRGIAEPSCE